MNNMTKLNNIQKEIIKFFAMYLKGANVNPIEPNESLMHNYFKYVFPTFLHFYLAGELFSGISNIVSEPYYEAYVAAGKTFPYPYRKADVAFTFNGAEYLIEFVYANKKVKEKIEMAKRYGLNLIIIDANGFYSNPTIKKLQKEGKDLEILLKFDTFLRNLLMKQNNYALVDIYKFA